VLALLAKHEYTLKDGAADAFAEIVEAHPEHPYARSARYVLGSFEFDALARTPDVFKKGAYRKAIEHLAPVHEAAVRDLIYYDSTFRLAVAYGRGGDLTKAEKLAKLLVVEEAPSMYHARGRKLLAEIEGGTKEEGGH